MPLCRAEPVGHRPQFPLGAGVAAAGADVRPPAPLQQSEPRAIAAGGRGQRRGGCELDPFQSRRGVSVPDRKSTRLNSSLVAISYAVFCLKKQINRRGPLYVLNIGVTFLSVSFLTASFLFETTSCFMKIIIVFVLRGLSFSKTII